MNNLTKTIAGVALAGVAVFGLSACATNSTPEPTAPSESSNVIEPTVEPTVGGDVVITPVTVNLVDINNTTQTLMVGQTLNLNVADEDPSVWSGVSSDPEVAKAVEGSKDATATFNPGVEGVKAGKATVTFTNSFTKEVITFEVNVSV